MAQIRGEQLLFELLGVGQVAVVCQRQAVRGVHVERLRLGLAGRTGGGIAHVADAQVALQARHVACVEDVTYQTVALAQQETALVPGHHARRVLTPVLQHRQGVVDCLVNRLLGHQADDTAHSTYLIYRETPPGGQRKSRLSLAKSERACGTLLRIVDGRSLCLAAGRRRWFCLGQLAQGLGEVR